MFGLWHQWSCLSLLWKCKNFEKYQVKIKQQLSNDYKKSEKCQLVSYLLRCLYTILSVASVRLD